MYKAPYWMTNEVNEETTAEGTVQAQTRKVNITANNPPTEVLRLEQNNSGVYRLLQDF